MRLEKPSRTPDWETKNHTVMQDFEATRKVIIFLSESETVKNLSVTKNSHRKNASKHLILPHPLFYRSESNLSLSKIEAD